MHSSAAESEGLDFVGLEHLEPHTGRALGSSDPGNASGPKKVFDAGDILYPRLRPYQNKVWRANRRGVCSSDQLVVRPTTSEDGSVLAALMRSQHVLGQAVDMTSSLQLPRIRQADFSGVLLQWPDDPESFATRAETVTDLASQVGRVMARQRGVANAYFTAALNETLGVRDR
jgi:hypothetical protein